MTTLKTAEDLVALPYVPPTHRIAYGPDSEQFGDLYLPDSSTQDDALLPVVIAIHGGCWRARYTLDHLSPFCAALAAKGVAVWSIEYRRVGNGGGWPNTFLDVGHAADKLREIAPTYKLDLNRVAAAGHSAGGHLVLWLAGRACLPASSPAYIADALKLRGVAALAAVVDLADSIVCDICGGNATNLMFGNPVDQASAYAQASPIHLLPTGVPSINVAGQYDDTVPPTHTRPYVEQAQKLGDRAEWMQVNDVGHYELVMPNSSAFASVWAAISSLL